MEKRGPLPFQNSCAKNGHILALYCYFKRLINLHLTIPNKLNDGVSGPTSLSLGLLDANGNRLPKDKGLFVTVHYDSSGKISELSTPQPVKFQHQKGGDIDSSVGYVEVGGEIYTLPVNKTQLMRLTAEVKQNQGKSLDISIDIPNTKEFEEQKKTLSEKRKLETTVDQIKGDPNLAKTLENIKKNTARQGAGVNAQEQNAATVTPKGPKDRDSSRGR